MCDGLQQLAQDIITMRKHPLKNNGARRYPAAAQQFDAAVRDCDDLDTLAAIIHLDSGHVLPPATIQRAYERLLADDAHRTAPRLRAYAFHLIMFGYTDADGMLVHDTDAQVDALHAEADQLEGTSSP